MQSLLALIPSCLSYILSFAILFTYWRAHHFFISVYAKNIDIQFTNINAFFLFFVALVPFSSSVLSRYPNTKIAVFIFAIHIICIGLTLLWMRRYAEKSVHIETGEVTVSDKNHAYAHILFPVLCAVVAIMLSFISIKLSLVLFTIGILFNLSTTSTKHIFAFLRMFNKKIEG